MEAIIELVPPLLASVGGMLPILLESLPASLDAKKKPLAIILLISIIWIVYILMLFLGFRYTFFSPAVTAITLAVGILGLVALFAGMSRSEHTESTTHRMSEFWLSMLYIISVTFLVAGFSNYLLMKNNIVLRFASSDECPAIEEVQWEDSQGNPVRLDYVDSMFGTGVVWPIQRFEKVENLIFYCRNAAPDTPAEEKIMSKNEGVYRPWGAGESYVFEK